jgi:hypothetical protein
MGKVYILERSSREICINGCQDIPIFHAVKAALDPSPLQGDHEWEERANARRCRLGYYADIDWYTPVEGGGTPILMRSDGNGDKFRIVEVFLQVEEENLNLEEENRLLREKVRALTEEVRRLRVSQRILRQAILWE